MNGTLRVEEGSIYDFLAVVAENLRDLSRPPWFVRARHLLAGMRQRNPAHRARRNVAHHYDLSPELYALFLDEDWQYSCAYFAHPGDSLEAAQEAKKRHIAAKLLLDRPGLRVLDIGSGWGGLALSLAREAGAEVTGVTLSAEQHAVSRRRAAASGLDDQVRFELRD